MKKRLYACLMIAITVITCAAHPASKDTAYIASKVVMSYILGSREMALLGTTSDGYQIWAYPNDSKMAYEKYAQWTIDDGTPISQNNRNDFVANYKWELNTDFNSESTRRTSNDTTANHFLKVKTRTTADFFTWSPPNIPSFAKEFQLAGTITPYVADINIEEDEMHITHQVAMNYTGFDGNIFDYARIEYSFDQGSTWQLVDSFLPPTSSTPVRFTGEHRLVRYRATLFPMSYFKPVLEKDSFVCESEDFELHPAPYNASKVIMNTGNPGTDVYMTYLGKTKVGYQIWACQGIDSHRYTYWKIDNGQKLSLSIGDFYSNTDYTLMTDYNSGNYRDIPNGSAHYHYIKVKGKEAADYCTWYGDKTFHPYSFYVFADITLKPVSDFFISETKTGVQQDLSYTIDDVNGEMINYVLIEASYNQGQSWTEIYRSADGTFTKGSLSFSNTLTANLTGEGDSVRYRLRLYPKDGYKTLTRDGYWTYETENFLITIPDDDIDITANAIDRTAYTDNEATNKRTYTANISWNVPNKKTDWIYSLNFKYSTDNGNTWMNTDNSYDTNGTLDVKVPAGYTHYLLSVDLNLKSKLLDIPALHRSIIASDTLIVTYKPAVTSFAIDSCIAISDNGQLRSVTCNYTLNEDLWQLRDYAVISYSYDNGKTWNATKQFFPNKSGNCTLIIDTSRGQCRLRLEVASRTDDIDKFCSAETPDLTF